MTEDRALRRVRAELLAEFPVRRAIYWIDLAASALLAWGGLAAVVAGPLGVSAVAAPIAVIATLRAAYFIHDVHHLRGAVRGFEPAWNLVVGAWVLLPSFMGDPHVDHHAPSSYGTAGDPEYDTIAGWSRRRLVAAVAAMVVIPPALVVRYGVIGPVSWLIPPLRRLAWSRMSTLQTNPRYVRRLGIATAPRVVAYEAMASAVVLGTALAIAEGALPAAVAPAWWGITAAALIVNQMRTLFAHAYENTGAVMSLAAQVGDSATTRGPGWLTGLACPLGTQFHALHHLAPTLPYHALRAADARAVERGIAAVYHRTSHAGFVAGVGALWTRAAPRYARAHQTPWRSASSRRCSPPG
jgi:fatty acid desaturase